MYGLIIFWLKQEQGGSLMPIGKLTNQDMKIPERLTKACELQKIGCSAFELIGANYWFSDENAEHDIGGSIVSWGYGPKEGLTLYITSPRFKGITVKRLAHDEGGWYLEPHNEYGAVKAYGKLAVY